MSLPFRRACLVVPSALLALAVAWLAAAVMAGAERGALDWILYGLFVTVMGWECLIVTQVALGFAAAFGREGGLSRLEARARALDPVATGRSRTAIVVPIFDEDVDAVFAGVAAMRRSLARLGPTRDIAVHVLSDTRDAATAAAEERAAAVADAVGPGLHYRRRSDNRGRKAGNIGEFLARTAGAYDFMVVLDADSLMSGAAIRKLIRLMEENERVALIQTISYAAGRSTLFARVQQFAVRLHAYLSLKGMAFWQGADGLYYGHNAIIRCAPFLDHAELPILPGRPPLGGEILCHDVVEAALLRRAGWEVRVLPDFGGTWEEMPTNVVDLLGRERRWCQGNLQHLRVLTLPGLTAGSRAHIAMGIVGYLVGPMWWAFLLLGAVRALLGGRAGTGLGVLAYGATEPGRAASALLWLSLAVILLPRLLNVLHALLDPRMRREAGGGARFLASAMVEQLFSCLLTPVLSLVTARFVLQVFAGSSIPWTAQSRADRDVGWAEAVRLLVPHVAVGACLATAAAFAGGWYGVWMVPTIAGLLSGPALVVISSRLGPGLAARRLGLFLTADETEPAPELIDVRAAA